MSKFAHLHVYTGYTNPEGVCDLRELAEKAQALGMEALAITDKNVMFGVPDFIRVCKCYKIKPIVGCEVTVGTEKDHHPIVLLCENMAGYENLVHLVSGAWLRSNGETPIVEFYSLKTHNEGLIALSGGPDSEINALLLSGDKEKAKAAVRWYRRNFGAENFFIELQSHGLPEESWLLSGLAELAKEMGVQTVATNAVHYVEKKDADFQSVRECIALGLTEGEYYGMGLPTDEYYLKSEEEMLDLFYGYEDAVTNAGKIAKRCACPDLFRWFSVPPFETPNGEPAAQFFREICRNGLEERLGWNLLPEHRARLEYELDVIEKSGAVDYFLFVWDTARYAKDNCISFGPGRGAAPGCLALYACGVTEIDPVKHGLIFERFMNPERTTMPDVDIDVATQDRRWLLSDLEKKYKHNREYMASVCCLNRGYSDGHALREICEALEIKKEEMYDKPVWLATEFVRTAEEEVLRGGVNVSSPRSIREKRIHRLSMLCDAFRRNGDLLRSVCRHACKIAILTIDETLDLIPLIRDKDGVVMTQYDKTALGWCGVLDMDFTPLDVLGMLDTATEIIQWKEPDFHLDAIDLADKDTFDMLRMGESESVFSFDSENGRNLLEESFPDSMTDLAAIYALDRPGTEDFIPDYLAAKLHPETVTYRTPALEPILKETGGVILYQEQIMEILHTLAGYSMGRADLVRRAIAKRMPEVLKMQREVFVYGSDGKDGLPAYDGCLKRGIEKETANAVFDDIEKYCCYAVCKAHAVPYALLAYRTAYLKCHYPEEWEAAVEKAETTDD